MMIPERGTFEGTIEAGGGGYKAVATGTGEFEGMTLHIETGDPPGPGDPPLAAPECNLGPEYPGYVLPGTDDPFLFGPAKGYIEINPGNHYGHDKYR